MVSLAERIGDSLLVLVYHHFIPSYFILKEAPLAVYFSSLWLHWVFVAAGWLSLVAVVWLLTVVASLAVDHGLYGSQASVVVVHRLNSCGPRA